MKKDRTTKQGKAWLRQEMRPYRAPIAFIAVLSVLSTLAALAFAYIVRYLVVGAEAKDTDIIILFSAVLLGVLLIKILAHVFYGYCSERLRSKMLAQKRSKIYGEILHSNYAKISAYHSGDLLNRITSDIAEVVNDTVGLVPTLISLGVQCVGAIAALLTLDPLFTGIYVACGALGGLLMALFRKYVKRYHKEFMQVDGEARSFMQEGISSLLTIKAYSAEERFSGISENHSKEYYKARMKRNVLRTLMSALSTLLGNAGMIFAIIWCSLRLIDGEMDFGIMLSVVLLLGQLQHPFSAVSGVIPAIYSRQASAERLQEITALTDESFDNEGVQVNVDNVAAIQLSGVSFDYGRERVLQDVNLTVSKGETVCIVGGSGAGKSTLFKLLLGVYTPTDGEIVWSVDGEKIPTRGIANSLFAYVPQGNFLFSGTIYENLTFFAPNTPTDEQLESAIKTAQAEFIYDLPCGIKTSLSERGAGLSEGQLQRLAIARALLSNRPMLLLDEATSALDSATEEKLLAALKALPDKTCILVTHRPAALAQADAVYEILDGKLICK